MKNRKKKKPPQPQPAFAGSPPRPPKRTAKALGAPLPPDLDAILDAITAEFLEEQLRKIKFK
jgi:hypothetical protein